MTGSRPGSARSNAPSRSVTRTPTPDLAADLAEVERHPQHDREHLARHHVAEVDEHAAAAPLDAERGQRVDPDGLGQRQLEHDLAGDDLEGLPHLARDVVPHLGHVADEVEVAAAGVGHALEQAPRRSRSRRRTCSSRRRGDAGRRRADELVVIGDADVREAVGEQQDAVHAVGREAAGDLLAAREPAAVEVGRAARVDGLQALGRELPALAGGRRRSPTTTSTSLS